MTATITAAEEPRNIDPFETAVDLVRHVRLATHPSIWPDPVEVGEALDLVDTWLAAPGSTVLEPSPRHTVTLGALLEETESGANLTTDAHLAAITLDHGAGI